MKNIFFWILGALFLAAGSELIYNAFASWNETIAFVAHASHAKGVVVRLVQGEARMHEPTFAPVIEFSTPDGRKLRFIGMGSSIHPTFLPDQFVDVLYEPANPEQARLNFEPVLWGPSLAFGGIGCVLATIGASILGVKARRRHVRAWLAESGARVKATYAGAFYEKTFDVFGRSPWRLLCKWKHPATQEVYLLRSDRIWFDPAPFVKREALDVLVNPDKPNQYYVDISFLPAKG